MKDLNITNAKEQNDILKEIQQRYGELVIKEISYGGAGGLNQFTVGSEARKCWEEYKEQKEKTNCPKCKKPDLEELVTIYRYRCKSCGHEIERIKK